MNQKNNINTEQNFNILKEKIIQILESENKNIKTEQFIDNLKDKLNEFLDTVKNNYQKIKRGKLAELLNKAGNELEQKNKQKQINDLKKIALEIGRDKNNDIIMENKDLKFDKDKILKSEKNKYQKIKQKKLAELINKAGNELEQKNKQKQINDLKKIALEMKRVKNIQNNEINIKNELRAHLEKMDKIKRSTHNYINDYNNEYPTVRFKFLDLTRINNEKKNEKIRSDKNINKYKNEIRDLIIKSQNTNNINEKRKLENLINQKQQAVRRKTTEIEEKYNLEFNKKKEAILKKSRSKLNKIEANKNLMNQEKEQTNHIFNEVGNIINIENLKRQIENKLNSFSYRLRDLYNFEERFAGEVVGESFERINEIISNEKIPLLGPGL